MHYQHQVMFSLAQQPKLSKEAAPTTALAPLERQSVAKTIRNPRLLFIEILAGLVTSLALIPEALAFAVVAGAKVPTVGDYGDLPSSLPEFLIPNAPSPPKPFRLSSPTPSVSPS